MPREKPKKLKEVLQMVSFENTAVRIDGWTKLHNHAAVYRGFLDETQWLFLRNLLWSEKEGGVLRAGLLAMLALSSVPPFDEASTGSLGNWLLAPFRKTSAVFGLTATKFRRRDENALTWLGRRLGLDRFPKTEIAYVSVEQPDLGRLLDHNYEAICLVGRPGLYGKAARERLSVDDLRFSFKVDQRPERLHPNQLDDDFHCIRERLGPGSFELHRTKEEDGYRTDYGIVQRYTVEFGSRYIVVVVCAGASSLGTLGAARWVASDLFHPTHPSDDRPRPIEVPPEADPNSRMEALLHVRAKTTTSAWERPALNLLRLYVDNHSWSLKDRKWRAKGPRAITVVQDGGRPVEILFDGQESQLRPDNKNFRLLVAMVQTVLAKKSRRLDIGQLAADAKIWGSDPLTTDQVRGLLRTLKHRHLHETLSMKGDIRLEAEVDIQDEPH